MPRLVAARFWFEGNAWSPRPTTLREFKQREWQAGEAALQAARGVDSELAALAAWGHARPDWQVTLTHACSAHPGGPVPRADFDHIVERIVAPMRSSRSTRRWDAVYLSLHGAAVVQGLDQPERRLVEAVRAAVGPGVPIGASFDLHGNAPPWDLLQAACVYRTYPHVDMAATAQRVLAQIQRSMDGGGVARGAVLPLGLALPSFNMRTAAGPMADLLALAAKLQAGTPGLWSLGLFGGFPYAGGPTAGASVAALGTAQEATLRGAADALAKALRAQAPAFAVQLPDAAAALRQALAAPAGLVAVTDPADNPYSGGAADTPGLLAALLEWRRADARARVPTLLAYLADADTVARAHAAGPGASLACELGGKTGRQFGAPVPLAARIERLCRARFTHRGPMEQGQTFDMGPSVVLDAGDGLRIIVTEQPGPANDPAFFDAHGIDLASLRLLCVKAKNHFRAAFEPLCSAIIDADVPGPAMVDLSRLPAVPT
jgi:microcystin degradation protein MlrC